MVGARCDTNPSVLPGYVCDMPAALVRRPGPRLHEGITTHIDRHPIDPTLAQQQWDAYVTALHEHGWRTIEVDPADQCPDAVFVEDAVVVFGDLCVVAHSGAATRRDEHDGAAQAACDAGYAMAHITAPGYLDGGDVLKIGSDVYVGVGGRTNAAGVAQLRDHVASRGFRVFGVPVNKVLHLKSAVTALPDGTVIGWEPLVDDRSLFDKFLAVPEPEGSHVVLLDDHHLLMSSSAPNSAELFRNMGYAPVLVDMSEFEKLEGCVTCLSVRLRNVS